MSRFEQSSKLPQLSIEQDRRGEHVSELGTPYIVPDSNHVDDYYSVPNGDSSAHYRVMFDTGEVLYDDKGNEMRRLVGGIESVGFNEQGDVGYILPEKLVYVSHLTIDSQKNLSIKYNISYDDLLNTTPDNPQYILDRLEELRREQALREGEPTEFDARDVA